MVALVTEQVGDTGGSVVSGGSVVTLGEVLEAWLTRGTTPMMERRERWSAGVALDHFGPGRSASTITPGELRDWAGLVVATYAPVSAQVTIRTVRQAFQMASDEGVLHRNPARDGLPRGIGSGSRA